MEATIGKRSTFERLAGDQYDTPLDAVVPLIPHLDGVSRYIEPCCGNMCLVEALGTLAPGLVCGFAGDIKHGFDALTLKPSDIIRYGADAIITNPSWTRQILHPLIAHFSSLAPTWLLFDADWAHTRQASTLLCRCSHIVAIGRVRWIRDTPHTGKDNAAWYRFWSQHKGPTKFIGREP
jgi:hypothetical protein